MNDTARLDLDDAAVFDMARRNHEPREQWTYGGTVTVTCRECGQTWPCPTITEIRRRDATA